MKNALSFIALAGICAALVVTTGCSKKGTCPNCEKEDQKLTKHSEDNQVCDSCIKFFEPVLESIVEEGEDENFFYEVGKKEKKDQFCDICKKDGKTIKIVTGGTYLCKPCKEKAKKQYEETKSERK